MTAAVWTVIAILGTAVFGAIGMFFYLGAKIDQLGARLDGRMDALFGRVDALSGRVDVLSERIAGLEAKAHTHPQAV